MYVWLQHTRRCVCEYIFAQSFWAQREKIFRWNLIYVLRACIAVAAIWCDSGLVYWVCIACTKLTTITLHTKPPGWMCFNEIRCNAEYAFSLHQNSTPQRIADGALHLAFSNYLFIIWWRTSFSVLLVAGKLFIISSFFLSLVLFSSIYININTNIAYSFILFCNQVMVTDFVQNDGHIQPGDDGLCWVLRCNGVAIISRSVEQSLYLLDEIWY